MIRLFLLKLLSKFHKRKEFFFHYLNTSGALPSSIDNRDYIVGSINIDLPKEISLRPFVREKKSQGALNSCVSHAICSAIELQLNIKDSARFIPLSELYNYYYGRKESGLFPQDIGIYNRSAFKSLKKDGITIELLHPYNVKDVNKEPSSAARSIAHIYAALTFQYYRIYTNQEIKQQLAIGIPVIVMIPWYSYWNNYYDNVLRGVIRNKMSKDIFMGYHDILITGYNDDGFEFLNSWGISWGDGSFGLLPYDYQIIERWIVETL